MLCGRGRARDRARPAREPVLRWTSRRECAQFARDGGPLSRRYGGERAAQGFGVVPLGRQEVVEIAISDFAEVEDSALQLPCENFCGALRGNIRAGRRLRVVVGQCRARDGHQRGGAFPEPDAEPAPFHFHGALAGFSDQMLKRGGHFVAPRKNILPVVLGIREEVDVRAHAVAPASREHGPASEGVAVVAEPHGQQRSNAGQDDTGTIFNDDLRSRHFGRLCIMSRCSLASSLAFSVFPYRSRRRILNGKRHDLTLVRLVGDTSFNGSAMIAIR